MISIFLNIIGFTQSLFLGSLLLIASKFRIKYHFIGGILILVFAIPIFNSVRILSWGENFLTGFELLSNYSLLLVGPLLYIYTKAGINHRDFSKNDIYHFVPFLILLSASLISRLFFDSGITLMIEIISLIVLILSMTIYQVLSIRLVFRHHKAIPKTFLYTIFGFTLVWHINLFIQIFGHFFGGIEGQFQIYATLLLSFLVLVLSYSHWVELLKKINPAKSKINLSKHKVKLIFDKIQSEMKTNQPYINNDFTLQKLAKQIDEPSSYVSYVINKEIGMSFPKFIARLRVKEFVCRAKQTNYQHLSIRGLSEEVGFKSPSTFNKSFKENMDMLPSKFMSSLKKQLK